MVSSLTIKNIPSELKEELQSHLEFKPDIVGGFHTDISETTNESKAESCIIEQLALIEKYSELFEKIQNGGGKTELYITAHDLGKKGLLISPEIIDFMARYGIGLGVD